MSDYVDVNGVDPVPGALCYVAYQFAWFTTQNILHQWGDDWDDAPYEHNSGSPYTWDETHDTRGCRCLHPKGSITASRRDPTVRCGTPGHVPVPPPPKWTVYRVQFDRGNLHTPGQVYSNSPWSVSDLNCRKGPWLSTELEQRATGAPFPTQGTKVEIYGGASFRAFQRLLVQAGGDVLVRLNELETRLHERRCEEDPDYDGESPLLD